MNYAERCRAEAAYYRRKNQTGAHSHARLAALLDAAAMLWEAEARIQTWISGAPIATAGLGGIESAMEACDAVAKEAE